MEEEEECCICLAHVSPTGEGAFLSFPGCGHRMHVTCALQQAQYRVRCPMCRHEPVAQVAPPGEGVSTATTATTTITLVATRGIGSQGEVDEEAEHWDWETLQRRIRNAQSRRRRIFHSRPELAAQWFRLKEVRTQMTRAAKEAQRLYDRKCREVYREDEELKESKRVLANLRRRERRLEQTLAREVGEEVGLF